MKTRRISTLFLAVVFIMVTAVPSHAADVAMSENSLTLQQAVDIALERSKALSKAEKEVDRTLALRDYADDEMDTSGSMAPAMSSAEEDILWNQFLSADLTWRVSQKSLDSAEDALVLNVCDAYWDILAAQEDLMLKEKLAKQAEIDLGNARVGAQVGTVSPFTLLSSEGDYQTAQGNLLAAKNTLEDAYNSFNQLVGLAAVERPVINEEPDYSPLEVENLEARVSEVVKESPSVFQAEEMVKIQKVAAELTWYTGEYTPYKARNIAVDQAELDADSAKDLIAQVTRSLYYSAKSLEESYAAAEQGLKIAQESLRITKVKYDLGMATKAEVAAAEAAEAQAEKALNDLVRQHSYTKLAFAQPWAVSSGS